MHRRVGHLPSWFDDNHPMRPSFRVPLGKHRQRPFHSVLRSHGARVAPLLRENQTEHDLPRTNPPTTAFARSCCVCPIIRLGSMDKVRFVFSWASTAGPDACA